MADIFLIDASHHIYRAYFAIKRLTTSKGFATNAVYGFLTILNRLLETYRPEYIACCFDAKGKTFRHEIFEGYKEKREKMPDDLVPQLPFIKQICTAMGIPIFELERYEADDLIGTLSEHSVRNEHNAIIVSTDKDLFQLVRDGEEGKGWVKVLYGSGEGDDLLDSAGVEKIFGVRPDKVVDVLALWGDSSDNVPGVPGIGEKGAKEIIQTCGSLEKAILLSDQFPNKRYRGKIAPNADKARLAHKLVTIDRNVPHIIWNPDLLKIKSADTSKLKEIFDELEFFAFSKRLEKSDKAKPPVREEKEADDTETAEIADVKEKTKVEKIGADALSEFFKTAEKNGKIAIYPDSPRSGFGASLKTLLFSVSSERVFAVDLKDAQCEKLTANFLKTSSVLKITHNTKRLFLFYPEISPPYADTMLSAYVINPEETNYSLESVVRRHLNIDVSREKTKAQAGLYDEKTIADGGEGCAHLPALWQKLEALLYENGLDKLYETLEMPLSRVLADMERAGVMADTERLKDFSRELETEIRETEAKITELAGEKFNVNSPQQLARILYEKLGLPFSKKTSKTKKPSTRTDVLEGLFDKHPIISLLLDYRQKSKLKSTYADALTALVNPATGRVHTSYDQCGAATGRLSSVEPNLQNIPIRTKEGRRIREAFVAPKGFLFVSCDYSQIELRVLAHLSQDATLCSAFREGADIHAQTAIDVLRVAKDAVTEDDRRRAKTVNFGILYGMSAYGLSEALGIPTGEADGIIKAYFAQYPGVGRFRDEVLQSARESGYVRTIFGRRRRIPEIKNQNRIVRQAAERAAFNTVIQGSAADLMKSAMLKVFAEYSDRPEARLILQVHDELVLEAKEKIARDVGETTKRIMRETFPLSVPLEADVKIGKNWAMA